MLLAKNETSMTISVIRTGLLVWRVHVSETAQTGLGRLWLLCGPRIGPGIQNEKSMMSELILQIIFKISIIT